MCNLWHHYEKTLLFCCLCIACSFFFVTNDMYCLISSPCILSYQHALRLLHFSYCILLYRVTYLCGLTMTMKMLSSLRRFIYCAPYVSCARYVFNPCSMTRTYYVVLMTALADFCAVLYNAFVFYFCHSCIVCSCQSSRTWPCC